MKTVNDFIKELQSLAPKWRDKPLLVRAPNGEMMEPDVKLMIDKGRTIFDSDPDKVIGVGLVCE